MHSWAARCHTWLLIKLTPKGLVFPPFFPSYLNWTPCLAHESGLYSLGRVACCVRPCPGSSKCTSNDVCGFCLHQAEPYCIPLLANQVAQAHVISVSVLVIFCCAPMHMTWFCVMTLRHQELLLVGYRPNHRLLL